MLYYLRQWISSNTIKWHVLAWVVYITYACLSILPYPDYYSFDVIIGMSEAVWVFYSSFLYLLLFNKKKFYKALFLLLTSIILYFILRASLSLIFSNVLKRSGVPKIGIFVVLGRWHSCLY